MKNNTIILSKDIQLFQRLGITLLMMALTRLLFLVVNFGVFNNVSIVDILAGIWMDAITIGMYFIPFYVLSLLPFNFTTSKWYQRVLKIVFHITNAVIIAFNLIDVEYFKFTSKRSTADLFSMATNANDMGDLFWSFFLDFWWLILIFIGLIIASNWLYNKTKTTCQGKPSALLNCINFIVVAACLVIIGRGGFSYRPADMLTAAELTNPQNTALVSNTPLAILKTIGKSTLTEWDFYPKGSANIYTPIHHGSTQYAFKEKPNIMIIVLESFGNEWIGVKNNKNYTPFLDSLLMESLYFSNGFANGKKSIESVPSIFAGIPSLMSTPYVSSNYSINKIFGLPQLLNELGYSSAFYHGATNGSMKFNVFTAKIGFDAYFGRTEFNDESKCGPTWGVLDEYFLPWTAASITKELKEPFLAGLFTLTSHHPYYVPEEYKNTLPKGEHPMAQAVAYSDMSLKLFFEKAKQQPWYDNTLFFLVADHTPWGISPMYKKRSQMYRIPIAIYDPLGRIPSKVDSTIFSQIDILPTILDIVGYPDDAYSLGTSYYRKKEPFAIDFIGNTYMLFQGDYMLNFINKESTGLYNYKLDSLMTRDSIQFFPKLKRQMEDRLKGYIQRFNHDLIYNEMYIK